MKNNKQILRKENIEKILNQVSRQKLLNLSNQIMNKNGKFKEKHGIRNPKLNKYKTSLKSLKMDTEIVQKVICLILDTIYKPYFFKSSFVCQSMFKLSNLFNYIGPNFFGGDQIIDNLYSTVNVIQLCNILNKKVQDGKFVELIYQFLKYEIIEDYQFSQSDSNIFQRHIPFSIFTDIYFNELDNWIRYKIDTSKLLLIYKYDKIDDQLFSKAQKKSKVTQRVFSNFESLLPNNTCFSRQQIKYFRYYSYWSIRVKGEQFLIKKLKIEISHFLIICLKQTIYSIKTINLPYDRIKFIGYHLYFLKNQKINYYIQYFNKISYQQQLRIKFDIPINLIFQKMEKKGYIRKLTLCYGSTSKINYIGSENIIVIKHFTQVWRGLTYYYSACNNSTKLQHIYCSLYLSSILTLSYKYNSNIKIILRKYGKTLTVFKIGITISFLCENNKFKKKKENET